MKTTHILRFSLLLFVLAFSTSSSLWACACGCGVFDVGTGAMLPTHEGGMAYLEYDFMNQNQNWHHDAKAPAEDNEDRQIESRFYTAGVQYMFNRDWGMMLDVPYVNRHFETVNDDDDLAGFTHSALGDIRLRGVYSGFSPDMSTGLTFGIKFPTGDYKYANFDRDIQTGSGSTNLLLGAYHRGQITTNNNWSWFVDGMLDQSVLITPDYRPGSEVNAVTGAYYDGWKAGPVKIAPVAQLVGSIRWSDTGADAAHNDSGYKRILFTPGLEFSAASWRVYTDMGFPIYQYVNGNQLVASKYVKLNISRGF